MGKQEHSVHTTMYGAAACSRIATKMIADAA